MNWLKTDDDDLDLNKAGKTLMENESRLLG